MTKKFGWRFALLSAFLCGGTGSAVAASGTWNNAAGGDWANAANWTGGVIPSGYGTANVAYFPGMSGAVTITSSGTVQINGLSLNGTAPDYTFTGGLFKLGGRDSDDTKRGFYVPADGRLTVKSEISSDGNVPVTVQPGGILRTEGPLSISSGGFWLVKKGAGTWQSAGLFTLRDVNFGMHAGTFEVVSGGKVINQNSASTLPIEVGRSGGGDAAIVIRAGGSWTSAKLPIQLGKSYTGTFDVDGGTVSDSVMVVGTDTPGILTVRNKGNASFSKLTVVSNGTAQVAVSEQATLTAEILRAGVSANAGTLTVSNATFKVTGSVDWKCSDMTKGAAPGGFALTVGPGAVVGLPATKASVAVGRTSLTLDGGTLVFNDVAGEGASRDNVLDGLDVVSVTAAGATFSYSGTEPVTVTQAITGNGSVLRKTGSGCLRFAGTLEDFQQIVILDGEFAFTGEGVLPPLRWGSSGCLSLADGRIGTVTLSTVEPLAAGIPFAVSIEMTETEADCLVFGPDALPAGLTLAFRCPNPVLTTDAVIARWSGDTAPAAATLTVPAGFKSVVTVDTVQRCVRASVLHDKDSSVCRWLNPAGGAWETASNWTRVPESGCSISFDSYLTAASAQIALGTPVTASAFMFAVPSSSAVSFTGAPLTLKKALDVTSGSASFSGPVTAPTVNLNAGKLALKNFSGVNALNLFGGWFAAGNGVSAAGVTVNGPDVHTGVVFETPEDLVLSGPVITTSPFVKLGAGTLTLTSSANNFSGDIYKNGSSGRGDEVLTIDPVTRTPVAGYRGLTVLNGRLIFDPGDNATIKIAGAVIAGGWSTNEENSETPGHIEFRSGSYVCYDWLTVGRNNGNENTAPEGLSSTMTIDETVQNVNAAGIWLAGQNGSSGLTSKAQFVLNGGSVYLNEDVGEKDHNHGIVMGNGVGNGLARPELCINGGILRAYGDYGLTLARDTGWHGRVVLNGGELRVRKIDVSEGGSGEIVLNGGLLETRASRTFDAKTCVLTRGPGGGTLETTSGAVLTFEADTCTNAAAGPLVKTGTGAIWFKASQSGTNVTVFPAGSCRVYAGVTLAGPVTVGPGVFLGIDESTTPGAHASVGGLDVSAGGILSLDAAIVNGSAVCDCFDVNGPVSDGGVVKFNLASGTMADLAGQPLTVLTYTGPAPDVSNWRVSGAPHAVFSAEDGKLTVNVGAFASDVSTWKTAGNGTWSDASNWDVPPSDPAAVRYQSVTTAVTVAETGVSVKWLEQNGAGVTLSGGPIAFTAGAGLLNTDSTLVFNTPVRLEGAVSAAVNEMVLGSASVTFAALEGSGSYGQSGGLLALTAPSYANALTLYGGVLAPENDTELASLKTVGSCEKRRLTTLKLTDAAVLDGDFKISTGTLETPAAPTGTLAVRDATFRYTGTDGRIGGLITGFTTKDVAPTLDIPAGSSLTVNGTVDSSGAVLVKRGAGELIFAGTEPGGVLAAWTGDHSTSWKPSIPGTAGSSPSDGLRSVNLIDGTTIFAGGPESDWYWNNTLAVGMRTTTDGAEKAATLIVRSGRLYGQQVAVGRANGTAVTAPIPLQSCLRVEGGVFDQTDATSGYGSGGIFFAGVAWSDGLSDCNAAPVFEVVGGEALIHAGIHGPDGPGGSFTGRFSGGRLWVCEDVELTRAAGAHADVTISGDADVSWNVTNGTTLFCTAAAGDVRAQATVNLNGGTLRVRGFDCTDGGDGFLNLNGGTLAALVSGTLLPSNSRITTTALAGGAIFDVGEGIETAVRCSINGEGACRKIGAGTLVLAENAQRFTGGTTVASGTLGLETSLASSLTLASGTVLRLSPGIPVSVTGAVSFESGAQIALDGNGRGIAPGDLALMTASSFTGIDGVTLAEGSPLEGSFKVEGSTLYLTVTRVNGYHVWTKNGGGAWSDAANWLYGFVPGPDSAVLFGDAASVPAEVTIGSGPSVSSLTFENTASSYRLKGTGPLALTSPAAVSSAGTHEIAVPVTLSDTTDMTVSSGTLTVSGDLSGPGGIVKKGSAKLSLAGVNTFSGGTKVSSASALEVSGSAPLGTGLVTLGVDGTTLCVPENASATVSAPLTTTLSTGGIGLRVPGANARLTQVGPITQTGNSGTGVLFMRKYGAGEWILAGNIQRDSTLNTALKFYGGTVRVTDGAEVEIRTRQDRASVDFNFNNVSGNDLLTDRQLIVERDAHLTVGGIFLGGSNKGRDGNNVTVCSGGILDIVGGANTADGFVIGNTSESVSVNVLSDGLLRISNPDIFMSLGAYKSATFFTVNGGSAQIANLSFGMNEMDVDRSRGSAAVLVTNGVVEVWNKMNWMGEKNQGRVNQMTVAAGGTFRVCTTMRSSTGGGQTTLTLDGGRLVYLPGGATAVTSAGWLQGLENLVIGPGSSIIDTEANDVCITQPLQAPEKGCVSKFGSGTLTFTATPSSNVLLTAAEGVLALAGPAVNGLRASASISAVISNAVPQTFAELSGEGYVSGSATVTGVFSPGTSERTKAGASLAVQNLTFADGATNRCDMAFGADGVAEANDRFDVSGTLTISGHGILDLNAEPESTPVSPSEKRLVLGTYGTIIGTENLASWKMINAGSPVSGVVFSAKDHVLSVTFKTRQAFLMFIR